MKKNSIFAFILVLTLTLFSGCRRPMEEPTVIPTTIPATAPATTPSQAPQTHPTVPHTTEAMPEPSSTHDATEHVPSGTGASEEATTGANSRNSRIR